ncbi:MAG: glycosyltransferase family 4 protein [Thermodesulfobacteriota bacterium]
MKVLHIITRLDRGGPPEVLFRLAKDTKQKGVDVVILTGPSKEPEEELKGFEERTGIPVHLILQLRRKVSPLRDLLALFSLIMAIKKESPDIIHTHTSKAGFIGRIAGRICGIKSIVHTPHGHILYGYFGKHKTWFFVQLERIASCFCKKIITLTSFEKDDYIRLNIAKEGQLVPIHCGVEVKQLTQKDSKVRSIKDELGFEGKLIGWVGRFVEIKGCFDFIDACKIVAEDFNGVGFLMVGDGDLMSKIKEKVNQLPFKDRFFLPGYRKDIQRIMSGVDIYVLTSLNEGLGLVLVEAMAAGKPVVATNVGGVSEVVLDGKTGILVPPEEPEVIAAAIERLLTNPDLMKSFGRTGRERARLFDVDEMVDKTLKLYREIIR